MTEQVRRASRLIEIQRILRQYPPGLTTAELAERMGTSRRTIERDLAVLESELNVAITVEAHRYKVLEGSTPLAPITFSLQEGRAVFLAARLLLRHAEDRDLDGVSALEKLAASLPSAIARHAQATVDELRNRPSLNQPTVLQRITEAWAGSKTVAIRYRSAGQKGTKVFGLDPYLLETSATGAATYVVGYSHRHKAVRVFRTDRIITAVISAETFAPPDVSSISARLRQSWSGVVYGGDDQYDVTIDFDASVSDRVRERAWHTSQQLTKLEAGGVRLELRLPSLLEFVPWVLGWGPAAQVIGPAELRSQVIDAHREALALYG